MCRIFMKIKVLALHEVYMKKMIISLWIGMILLIAGCGNQAEGICPYMIMVENELYYCYDEVIEVEDAEVLGYITSYVSIKYTPEENNQSNFPDCMEEPYGVLDGQMLIYYENDWHICYPVEEGR